MWWVLHNAHGAFAARGVHGQTIYLDPTAEMVIVRLSSFPDRQERKTSIRRRYPPIRPWPSI
jgi:CubicO group peptidase (beta-lactamase class C family)